MWILTPTAKNRFKVRTWSFLLIMALSTTNNSHSGLYGSIGARIQTDNLFTESEGFIEELVDVTYSDKPRGISSGLSFALRQGDANEGNLYQLYLEKDLGQNSSFTLGRMQRADGLGFYILDGGSIAIGNENLLFSLYGGIPSRIDDYFSVEADALYGFDLQFMDFGLQKLLQSPAFISVTGRIGWQHLVDDVNEDRLNWGLSSSGEISDSMFKGFGLVFNGTYIIDENYSEDLLISAYTDLKTKSRVQIDYEMYSPDEPYLTFRERFYSVYANGRQSALTGSLLFNSRENVEWIMRGRSVEREFGVTGYGGTAGVTVHKYSGNDYSAQLDYLDLGEDNALSLYMEIDSSLSYKTRVRLSTALQHQEKQLPGSNDTVGIELGLEHMFRSDLFFVLSLSHIWNSRLNDEYVYGMHLSYRFDDRKAWWRHE